MSAYARPGGMPVGLLCSSDQGKYPRRASFVTKLLFGILAAISPLFAQPTLTKMDVDVVKPGKTVGIVLHGHNFNEITKINAVFLGKYETKIKYQDFVSASKIKLRVKIPTNMPLGSFRFSFQVTGLSSRNWILKSNNTDLVAAPEITVAVGGKTLLDGQEEPVVFDSAFVDQSSEQTFEIVNKGTEPLILTNPKISGGFILGADFPDSIPAGETVEINIALRSKTPGEHIGQLEFDNNDSNEGHFVVPLKGTVKDLLPSPLAVSSASTPVESNNNSELDFGSVEVSNVIGRSLTIRNTSNSEIELNPPQLSAGFGIDGEYPERLAAHDSITFQIIFRGDSIKNYSAPVVFSVKNRPAKPFVFAVSANVVAPLIETIAAEAESVGSGQTEDLAAADDTSAVVPPETEDEEKEADADWIPVVIVISVTAVAVYSVSYLTKLVRNFSKAGPGSEALVSSLKFQPSRDPGEAKISETEDALGSFELRVLPVPDIGAVTVKTSHKQLITISKIKKVKEPVQQQSAESDNLRRIEGIGPKISALLNENDISTYAQLSHTEAGRLLEILQAAKITIADPTTWPTQAALAAEQEWDALKKLQDKLKGGRLDKPPTRSKGKAPLRKKADSPNQKKET